MSRRSFSRKDRARIFAAFNYDPSTGLVTWRQKQPYVAADVGDEVGSWSQGYRRVKFSGQSILVHRIAWLLHYGEEPDGQLDHVNGNRSDNRIGNLRSVSHATNMLNKAPYRKKTPLPKGVTYHPSTGKYRARITLARRVHSLGLFTTPEAAAVAYADAASRLFGEMKRWAP